jgi:hypothetical protein
MKYLINESQLKNIIKSNFGVDLTDKIHMVTSKWELPEEFDFFINPRVLNKYLNKYGPMFVFEIGKHSYLTQNQGSDGWMIIDNADRQLSELEFMKILGIEYLGLSMDNLLDEYFKEKSINEQVTDEPEDNMTKIIQSYLDMNLPNYYAIKRFLVDYNEQFDSYDINIFFDRQMAIDMGGGINMLLRNAKYYINEELNSVFNGAKFSLYEHFED